MKFNFFTVEYCLLLWHSVTTVRFCPWLQSTATLCWILSKSTKMCVHLCSKFIHSVWWVRLRLKLGHFLSIKCLSLILFTIINEKWLKFVPNFVEILNETIQSKTKTFRGSRFKTHFDFLAYPFIESQNLSFKFNIAVTYFASKSDICLQGSESTLLHLGKLHIDCSKLACLYAIGSGWLCFTWVCFLASQASMVRNYPSEARPTVD